MTLLALRNLTWLQLRLRKNLFTSSKYSVTWLSVAIGVFFCVFLIYSSSKIAAEFGLKINDNLEAFLTGFFFVAEIFSLLYSLYIGLEVQSPAQLRHIAFLPINAFSFYLTETVSSILDFSYLLLAVLFLGVVLGLDLGSSPSQIILISGLFLLFILFTAVFNFCFITYFESFLGSRIPRYQVIGLALILLAGVLALSWTSTAPERFLAMTPFGLIAAGITEVVRGTFTPGFVIAATSLLAYLMIFLFLGFRVFLNGVHDRRTQGDRFSGAGKLFRLERIVHMLVRDSQFAILFSREIVYSFRSNRTKGYFILYLLLSVFYFLQLRDRRSTIICLTMPAVLFALDGLFYVFTYEGKEVKSYFLLPIKPSYFFVAKNLSHFLIIVLSLLCYLTTVSLLNASFVTLFIVISSSLLVVYYFFALAIIADYLVIKNPKKVPFNSVFRKSTFTGNFYVILVALVILSLPNITVFWVYADAPRTVLLFLLSCGALSGVLYWKSLNFLTRHLDQEKEDFITLVS